MRPILLAAAAFNISGGILLLFLLEHVAPLLDFAPLGNMLFRLFVGGTAVTFGIGYLRLALRPDEGLRFLYYGAGLKYWAFLASLYSFAFADLSLAMLLLFGCANLVFAVLFTGLLLRRRRLSD